MSSQEYSGDVDMQYQAPIAGANVIDIPLRDDQEVVTLNLDTDLPDDPTELCDLLENEDAGRQFWLAISTAYSKLGKIEEAIEVIMRGLTAPVVVKGTEMDKTPFHTCLTWLYLKQVREAPKHAHSTSIADSSIKTSDSFLQAATSELNVAFQMYSSWPVNILARGVFFLLQPLKADSLDNALQAFDNTIKVVSEPNLFAFLGRARVLYSKENYKGALKLYQQVLVARPDMKPDPRIGIGLCFWKLGFKDDAKMAWDRTLELDPDNTPANALIGLYYQDKAYQNVAAPEFVELYGTALKYTQKAYKLGGQKVALAGIGLASYLFSKKVQMETVIKLCERVIDYTDVPAITSDAYFWIARAYHYQENYERAMTNYQWARNAKADNVSAKVGMGQIQIINKDLTEAKLTFEKVIQDHPKCAEAMLLLGYLYASEYTHRAATAVVGSGNTAAEKTLASEKTKAKNLLERYLKLVESPTGLSATEIDAHILLSRLYEDESIDQAMASLQPAMGMQQSLYGAASPRVLNNMGVLKYQKGQFDQAAGFIQSAIEQLATATVDDEQKESLIVTLTYNLGRLQEQIGRIDDAKSAYAKVEVLMPGYVDARLRLCYLALKDSEDGGSTTPEEAMKKMQELIETESGNLEVRALHGWYLHQHQRKRPPPKNINEDIEQRHYKHTLLYYDKYDIYSLTAMANIHLAAAREMRPASEADADKRKRAYERAVELFDKCLQLDGNNAYAAQGIAIALAEEKKYNIAAGIFGKIRETLNDVSPFINLGHCLTEMKNYSRAIECYEIALDRFQGGRNVQTMMCLGRAWLQRGIDEMSLEAVKTALSWSLKALALSPLNVALKFNVAFCQFQIAEVVRRMPMTARKISDIEAAASGLEEAIVWMAELAGDKHPPYPSADIEQRATMGQNTTRRQLERLLAQQKEFEEKNEAKLEAARRARESGSTNGSAAVSAATTPASAPAATVDTTA
ncbi:hypothetical protein V1512DRAFT_229890 [Lipomyces arxii]|uniref:uncharacterized protein n=1 Tax=Lipomyces arxii TaxID=56418 RepID=UPI0034CF7C1F